MWNCHGRLVSEGNNCEQVVADTSVIESRWVAVRNKSEMEIFLSRRASMALVFACCAQGVTDVTWAA